MSFLLNQYHKCQNNNCFSDVLNCFYAFQFVLPTGRIEFAPKMQKISYEFKAKHLIIQIGNEKLPWPAGLADSSAKSMMPRILQIQIPPDIFHQLKMHYNFTSIYFFQKSFTFRHMAKFRISGSLPDPDQISKNSSIRHNPNRKKGIYLHVQG